MRALAMVMVAAACEAAPANPDARPDVSPYPLIDAAYDSCDPIAQTGCSPLEKCSWTRTIATTADQHGLIECVPDGTAALAGTCTWGAAGTTTGYDTCQTGLVCLAPVDQDMATGVCEAICDVLAAAGTAEACAAGFTCMRHPGFFANATDPMPEAGLCDPS
jgi:hypothetical protein